MTENNVDTNFVDGLQLIIDSLIKEDESDTFEESTAIEKILPLAALGAVAGAVGQAVGGAAETGADAAQQMSHTDEKGERLGKNTEDLPEADHWCPDVMDWHTSDHEPAKAPSVHVNVDQDNGDDPYQSENEDVDKSFLPNPMGSGSTPIKPPPMPKPKIEKGEYDQNTNLPPEFGKPEEGESIAEPFLRKREAAEEDIEKQAVSPLNVGGGAAGTPPSPSTQPMSTSPAMAMSKIEYDQSLSVLKIWASVDRALPKDEEFVLVDDLSILKSFGLETSTNVEDLVEGTLVHKMLVDRANRPTKEWWDSGIELAKSVEGMDEPAICIAFLYYEPDTFDMRDFQKANPSMSSDRATRHNETQDVQNVGSASAIDGLGMSADGHAPEDKECET